MELFLLKDETAFVTPVLVKTFTKEENIELVVPDTMPDADSILSVATVPMMREKEAFLGKMVVSGVVDTAVFYESGAADATQRLMTTIEFSSVVECEKIDADSLLLASVRAVNADARVLNSRKVSIHVELQYDVAAYNKACATLPCGISGSETVETLVCERSFTLPTGVCEKVFSVNDTAKTGTFSDVTVGDVEITVEDARIVGTKAVVKGTAATTLLFDDAEKRVDSPFSQVVDLDICDEPKKIWCDVMTTGAYASVNSTGGEGDNEVALELSLVCQCVSFDDVTVKYLADAYSVSGELEIEKGSFSFPDLKNIGENGPEYEDAAVSYLAAVCENECEGVCDRPSLYCCRARSGDTVWSIGKKYCAARAGIIAANNLGDDAGELSGFIIVPAR